MESDIYLLQLAEGVREALVNGGFSTIKSILESTTSDISNRVGIDPYVAQIIFEEAKRPISFILLVLKNPVLPTYYIDIQ